MAALAAIFMLLPSHAFAAACEHRGLSLADYFPALGEWVAASPQKAQLQQLLQPATWVTGAILIWLLAGNSIRSTIVAICWFALLTVLAAMAYVSVDLANPDHRAAIAEGCLEGTPYRIYINLLFTAIAVALTIQRLQKRRTR